MLISQNHENAKTAKKCWFLKITKTQKLPKSADFEFWLFFCRSIENPPHRPKTFFLTYVYDRSLLSQNEVPHLGAPKVRTWGLKCIVWGPFISSVSHKPKFQRYAFRVNAPSLLWMHSYDVMWNCNGAQLSRMRLQWLTASFPVNALAWICQELGLFVMQHISHDDSHNWSNRSACIGTILTIMMHTFSD